MINRQKHYKKYVHDKLEIMFAQCIDIKLDEEVQLIYYFTSLHIQRELFVI